MKNPSMRCIPLAVALALSLGVAVAQPSTSTGTTGTGSSATGGGAAPAAQPGTGTRNTETRKDDKIARGDRKFVMKAAEGGMFEVEAGQLAASKASDPAVKTFGQMLVDDHTAANKELTELANSKGVELPASPPRDKRRMVEKLGKKSGAEFDREYVREVGIKDHEKDVKDFRKASKDVKDPQIKAWVDKTLPTLEKHLAEARKLSPSRTSSGSTTAPAAATGASKTGS